MATIVLFDLDSLQSDLHVPTVDLDSKQPALDSQQLDLGSRQFDLDSVMADLVHLNFVGTAVAFAPLRSEKQNVTDR